MDLVVLARCCPEVTACNHETAACEHNEINGSAPAKILHPLKAADIDVLLLATAAPCLAVLVQAWTGIWDQCTAGGGWQRPAV